MSTGPDTVYFLRPVGAEGPVKIGVSFKPEDRLHFYNQMSPVPLEIAATIPGTHQMELRFHTLFERHWSHHEWFRAHADISSVIRQINDGTLDIASLPPARRIGKRANGWDEEARRSASWTHRFNGLMRRGIAVPPEVHEAYRAYSYGRVPKRLPADRAIVEAFLEGHPRITDRRAA